MQAWLLAVADVEIGTVTTASDNCSFHDDTRVARYLQRATATTGIVWPVNAPARATTVERDQRGRTGSDAACTTFNARLGTLPPRPPLVALAPPPPPDAEFVQSVE